MSTLLEQASLIMIPSGYKEDVVYSVIPENGNGDLSFTRASNGTRVNSAGLVEVCPWNLASYSEDFANAYWNPNSNTITANTTTAPNGTTTADTFTLTPSSDSSVYQAVNGVSNNYTISVYAKYVSGDKYLYFFSPLNSQGAKVWFDIQNGTVSNQLSGFTGTIENAGNGWYKCSMYQTTASVLDYIQFGISTTNSSRTLSNNSVSYFWGAQVNLGTAKPYFPTTDRLDVPRLTYQNGGGGCPSLLLEKQSTNLCLYSEQFDDASWTKARATITANATTSPDGTTNADKFIENTANDSHAVLAAISNTSGQQYAVTIYAKASERNWFLIYVGGGPAQGKFFNLSNGTLGSVLGNAPNDSSIINVGNGWYRCSITYTATDASSDVTFQLATSDGTNSYTGDGTSGLFIYGAQVEQSSYPTSYIPTTSSSATRVADACSKTGISSLIGQSEGVVFIDFVWNQLTGTGSYPRIIEAWNNVNNYIQLFNVAGTESVYYEIANGGSIQFSGNTTMNLGRNKLALAYKLNDCVFYKNGALIASDTSATIPATNDLGICGTYNGQSGAQLSASVNQAILFPTRLTNAELASLTTI